MLLKVFSKLLIIFEKFFVVKIGRGKFVQKRLVDFKKARIHRCFSYFFLAVRKQRVALSVVRGWRLLRAIF